MSSMSEPEFKSMWIGWTGLSRYDVDKLFIALRAAHIPVFKGGDVVIANSMDFAMLNDIMHGCNIEKIPGQFKAVAFSDAEIAEWERKLSEDANSTFSSHAEDVRKGASNQN